MNRRLPAAVLAVALPASALGACADAPVQMTDATWLVTNIYTTPEAPDAISNLVTDQPTIEFGHGSISGFTGCVPFQGFARFTLDGAEASSDDADLIEFTQVVYDELPDDCTGQERLVHQDLTVLLDGPFEINRRSDTELLLVQQVEQIDRPSIRLVSWIAG